MIPLALALFGAANAAPPAIDLLRAFPGDAKIFVQATLPDGEKAIFLVDTGADLSAISGDIAERLGLHVQHGVGELSGLSGSAPMNAAVLPSLDLGGTTLRDLNVAVDIPGLSDDYFFMPIDGLLGNNVWSQFVLEIDYPADVMVLHPHGSVKLPKTRSEPLFSDGGHIWSTVVLHTGGDASRKLPDQRFEVEAVLDTGLRGFIHRGHTGEAFETAFSSEGIEPIYGLGAADTLPPDFFLTRTRRIPLTTVDLGGASVPFDGHVQWLQFDTALLPPGLATQTNIIGHEAFEGHAAFFDYGAHRFALRPSKRPARQLQAHQILLDQDVARYGEDPTRSLFRAKMHIGLDDLEKAETDLRNAITWADAAKQSAIGGEARVLLGQLLRGDGRIGEAWEVFQQVPTERLMEEDALVGMVNGLILEDRLAEAVKLADDAVQTRPDDAWGHVARSDAALAAGDIARARTELRQAVTLDRYPDAHLFRRARVALADGDRDGALAMLRRIVQINPLQGKYLWFYGMIVQDDEKAVFRADLARAISQLHPEDLPLDFLVASYDLLGDAAEAQRYLSLGIARDCESFEDDDLASSKDNCIAWYNALAGVQVDDALARVEKALASEGPRSDFLDTKAMVYLRRGDYKAAFDAAMSAARLAPDDLYMLWQVQRLSQLAGAAPAPHTPG